VHSVWWPIAALAVGRFMLLLAYAGSYGWHRDELYYLVGGRHWDLAYVDHALLAPWVAGAVDALVGPSLVFLRLIPALIGSAMVVMTALVARELGGGRRAQVLAAACFALDPFFLGAHHLFQTVTFDQLAWLLASFALVRLLRTGDGRWWLGVGAAVAFGLLAKPTILLWVLGAGVGVLVTPARRHLRSRWLAVAVLLASVAAIPFLVFQVHHAWPFPEFVRHMNDRTAGEMRAKVVPEVLFHHDPLSMVVWLPGLFALFRNSRLRTFVPLAWAFVVPLGVLFVLGGKSYYVAPMFPILYAAGAVALTRDRAWSPRRESLLIGSLAMFLLLVVPAVLPILPVRTLADTPYALLNKDQLEEIGWHRFVHTVSKTAGDDPHALVLTSNYGEAGALEVLGHDLPPLASRQNSYWIWGPRNLATATDIFAVGFTHGELRGVLTGCRGVGLAEPNAGVDNDESTAKIFQCDGIAGDPTEVWSRLKSFS
jgi:4-amino-4-deoxy-L-arabinose transferase-like glycosyltransferase